MEWPSGQLFVRRKYRYIMGYLGGRGASVRTKCTITSSYSFTCAMKTVFKSILNLRPNKYGKE
jgi:hypothetical protein